MQHQNVFTEELFLLACLHLCSESVFISCAHSFYKGNVLSSLLLFLFQVGHCAIGMYCILKCYISISLQIYKEISRYYFWCAKGIVRTSVIVTGVQVCSRIFMVWFVTNSIRQVSVHVRVNYGNYSLLTSVQSLNWVLHLTVFFFYLKHALRFRMRRVWSCS